MLVLRGGRINLLLVLRKSKRILLCTDHWDRVVATRAKAKVNHSGVGDTSGLLANQGRERVFIVTSVDNLDGIALRGRDPRVLGHHNSNHQWDMHRRGLFLLTPSWARGTGISPRVLHKHLLVRIRATWAMSWVEVQARTSKLGLQGPKGASTP